MGLKFVKVTTDKSGVVEKAEIVESGQAEGVSPPPSDSLQRESQDSLPKKSPFTPVTGGGVKGVPKNVRPRTGFTNDEGDDHEPSPVKAPPAPSPKGRPGRPPGKGKNKTKTEPEVPVISRATMLAGQLEFGHAMIGAIIPGFQITPTQSKAYGEALDNFFTAYKIEVSEKSAALMGLITVAGAIELPKLQLAKRWIESHGGSFGKKKLVGVSPEVMKRDMEQLKMQEEISNKVQEISHSVNSQGIAAPNESAVGIWAHQSNQIARSDD